jgi:hypothetical protein
LPVAPLPLWQVVQLVAALKLVWSTLAADQVLVLVAGLAVARHVAWVVFDGLPTAGA